MNTVDPGSNNEWTAAVLAEATTSGRFRPVLVLSWADGSTARDAVVPLEGEYDSRLAAEEGGKDALAAMSLQRGR